MIKAVALDDEPLALQITEAFCKRHGGIELIQAFTKTAECSAFLENHPVDLIFLDIQMPSMSGIDFYRKHADGIVVIFTTAYSDYAVEGFNLDAADYLLKPFSYERFAQAIEKARFLVEKNTPEAPKYLLIRADYSLKKIDFAQILYLEGLDDYVKIYIENQKTVVARMTMKAMMEKLPTADFIRIHRSFIVPFARIEQVRNKELYVAGTTLPVSQSYEAALLQRLRS